MKILVPSEFSFMNTSYAPGSLILIIPNKLFSTISNL